MLKCKIADIRHQKDMTQAELSKRTDLHIFQISRYENNRGYPTAVILWKIAKALGCEPGELYEEIEKD